MLTSDHVPLLLTCTQNAPMKLQNRLELFWLRYKDFRDITHKTFASVDNAHTTDPLGLFSSKLDIFHSRLKAWHKEKFVDHGSCLDNCAALIKFFDSLEELRTLTALERFLQIKTRERAYEVANNDEIKWHQRARCHWMTHGDRNTRFFHALASSRSRTKAIVRLQHEGTEISSQRHIMQVFFDHYKGLLGTSQQQNQIDLSTLYDRSPNLHLLDSPFSPHEVQQAVSTLALNKASGPDSLPNEFLKQSFHYLDLIS